MGELEAALPLLRRLTVERRRQEAAEEAREEATACSVCLVSPKDTRLDCGHLLCDACSRRVQDCPMCRVRITSRQHAFL